MINPCSIQDTPKTSDQARIRAQRARQVLAARPKMQLSFRCVDIANTGPEMDAFQLMLDRAKEVSFSTFARHVDYKPIAHEMGYAAGMGAKRGEGIRLDKDYAVSFKTSTHEGERVYFMVHSAIEYVFKRDRAKPVLKMRTPWS